MSIKIKNRDSKISKMVRSGMTLQEIADHFGISKGRVSQILAQNKVKVNTALLRDEKISREIIKQEMNVKNSLIQINRIALDLLDFIDSAVRQGNTDDTERLKELGVNNAVAELRATLKEAREGQKMLVDTAHTVQTMELAEEFKQAVIEAIKAECDSVTTRNIIKRLKCAKSLDRAVGGN